MRYRTSQTIAMTSLVCVLFLAPAARAQDEKDAEIRLLKDKLELQKKESELQKKNFEIIEKQLKMLLERTNKEVDLLNKTIAEREKTIVKLEGDVKALRNIAAMSEATARTLEARIETLLKQVRELTGNDPKGVDPKPPVRPIEPSPPPVKLDGKIQKIDGNLVQINLGTDHGLKENHTLDVYRIQPQPKYLGMIRITDAYPNTSIGRVVPRKDGEKVMLKEGDLVTSQLGAKEEPKKDPPTKKEKRPAKKVEGTIEKIDAKDATLVTISIGSDVGIAKFQMLEVYRDKPEATYLAQLQIIDVSPTKSQGFLKPIRDGAKLPKVEIGDKVSYLFSAPPAVVREASADDVIKAQDEVIRELRERLDKHRHALLVAQEHEKLIKKQAEEIEQLKKLIKDREVIGLLEEIKQLKNSAKMFELQARARQQENEKLLEQVRELTRKLAQAEAGVKPGGVAVGGDPKKSNPPPNAVEGKITKVTGPLVELNLGSDHGLKENYTLEVLRLAPQPKYLGMIRIVEVSNHRSVARFVGKMPELKEGDTVTSKLK